MYRLYCAFRDPAGVVGPAQENIPYSSSAVSDGTESVESDRIDNVDPGGLPTDKGSSKHSGGLSRTSNATLDELRERDVSDFSQNMPSRSILLVLRGLRAGESDGEDPSLKSLLRRLRGLRNPAGGVKEVTANKAATDGEIASDRCAFRLDDLLALRWELAVLLPDRLGITTGLEVIIGDLVACIVRSCPASSIDKDVVEFDRESGNLEGEASSEAKCKALVEGAVENVGASGAVDG